VRSVKATSRHGLRARRVARPAQPGARGQTPRALPAPAPIRSRETRSNGGAHPALRPHPLHTLVVLDQPAPELEDGGVVPPICRPDGRYIGMIWCALMAAGLQCEPRGTGVATTEIRPAHGADLSAVVACVDAAYSKYIVRIGKEPAPMQADYPALIGRGVVHVLPEPSTGDLCALIVLWPTGGAMFVENVAVHPRYQGQGLGRRLMAFAEEQARAANLPEVRLYTNEAMTENLAFYRRLGFKETGRRVEEGYSRVFLRKILVQMGGRLPGMEARRLGCRYLLGEGTSGCVTETPRDRPERS
jgi:ribosomal protein S18 acetylase RimI-like enzyme